MTIGFYELLILLLGLFVVFIPFFITIFLRKRYPGKIWLGILLSIILNPIGQLYIEKAIIYIIILFVFFSLSNALISNVGLSWFFTDILSAMIMYYRLIKVRKI